MKLKKKILLIVNSTFILDSIFNKLRIDLETRSVIIGQLQNNRNKNTNIKKILVETLKLDSGVAQDLVNILSVSGDIDQVKKKIEKDFKKFNILDEIEYILSIFSGEVVQDFNVNFTIKLDLKFTPYEMLCYSGVFFEAFSLNNLNSPICFGGRLFISIT